MSRALAGVCVMIVGLPIKWQRGVNLCTSVKLIFVKIFKLIILLKNDKINRIKGASKQHKSIINITNRKLALIEAK